MQLSEAILLGSIGSEQGFGPSSAYPDSVTKCGIGSALFAVGAVVSHTKLGGAFHKLIELWPWTRTRVLAPNVTDRTKLYSDVDEVYDYIWQLNDKHKWTRLQIAAWVAELEKIYDPTPVEVEECHLIKN